MEIYKIEVNFITSEDKVFDRSNLYRLMDKLNKNLCLYDESLYEVLREIN
jgi:hypothetical protein